jgi:mono/diheme cytochrome c family protein
MRFTIVFVAIAAGVLASLATMSAQSPSAAGAAGNPVTGKKLYESYTCYGCHGFTGETGARALLPGKSANLASETRFIAFLRARANVAPNEPSTSMPNYSAATLTDAQARDVYAYIRTFKSNAPEVQDIPVFKQILSAAQKPHKP